MADQKKNLVLNELNQTIYDLKRKILVNQRNFDEFTKQHHIETLDDLKYDDEMQQEEKSRKMKKQKVTNTIIPTDDAPKLLSYETTRKKRTKQRNEK